MIIEPLSLRSITSWKCICGVIFSLMVSITHLAFAVPPRESAELEHSQVQQHSHHQETKERSAASSIESKQISKLFMIDQKILEITRQRRETRERLYALRKKKTHYLSEIKNLSQRLKSDRIMLIKLLSIKERVRSTRIVELLLSADGPLDQKRREVYIQAIFESGSQRFRSLLKSKYELENKQRAAESLSKREQKLTTLLEDQSQNLNAERQAEWLAISKYHESSGGRDRGAHSREARGRSHREGKRVVSEDRSRERFLWENMTRLSPTQGQWIDEFRKFRGVELAKMYGGGIWILNQSGAPVYAVDQGRVIFSGQVRGWGGLILIQHRYGYMSIYGNLSELMVREGQEISMQEKIGSIGSEMSREGLYFELRRGGELIHPSRWLSRELSSIKDQYQPRIERRSP